MSKSPTTTDSGVPTGKLRYAIRDKYWPQPILQQECVDKKGNLRWISVPAEIIDEWS
jgi:hypothetical protein